MAAATLEEILDALNDYSDYDEVGSVARARSFVTAARRFLQLPSSSAEQGSSLGYSPQLVQKEIAAAIDYIAVNDEAPNGGTGSVRFLSISRGFMR
jgi:hypothetical protein